jgi:hypothetical protein
VKEFSLKITTPKGYAYRKIEAETFEGAKNIIIQKMEEIGKRYLSVEKPDHRHKLCSVKGCTKNATHGTHKVGHGGKIIKENWKCKECYYE